MARFYVNVIIKAGVAVEIIVDPATAAARLIWLNANMGGGYTLENNVPMTDPDNLGVTG